MKKIVFSQGDVGHLRIGNSFVWMSRAFDWAKKNRFAICFPMATRKFANFIDPDSSWLNCEKSLFDDIELAKLVRYFQVEWEGKNNKKPYDFAGDVCLNITDTLGLIFSSGYIKFDSVVVESFILSKQLVIIHEPFPFFHSNFESPTALSFSQLKPSLLVKGYLDTVYNKEYFNVALHVRRGDYAVWNNGDCYFNDQSWIDLIKTLKCLPYLKIYIFSNDYSSLKVVFETFTDIISMQGVEDHIEFYCIGMADVVIGPPSTFSHYSVKLNSVLNGCSSKIFQLNKNNFADVASRVVKLYNEKFAVHTCKINGKDY